MNNTTNDPPEYWREIEEALERERAYPFMPLQDAYTQPQLMQLAFPSREHAETVRLLSKHAHRIVDDLRRLRALDRHVRAGWQRSLHEFDFYSLFRKLRSIYDPMPVDREGHRY